MNKTSIFFLIGRYSFVAAPHEKNSLILFNLFSQCVFFIVLLNKILILKNKIIKYNRVYDMLIST